MTVLYSKGKPVCDWVEKCKDCYKTNNLLKRKPFNPHKCGEVYCNVCARFFGRGLLCFMKKLKVSNCNEKKENKKKKRPRGDAEMTASEEEGESECEGERATVKRKIRQVK